MAMPTWLELSQSWDQQREKAAEAKIREEEMARKRLDWEQQDKQNAAIETERAAAVEAVSRPFADGNSAGGYKAALGLDVPQSPAAMRRGDERFQYGQADVATPEAPGAQPQFALDQQANTLSALNMAGRDPRAIMAAREADTKNRLNADAARIASYAQSANPTELKDLMGKVSLDKRNKYETDFNPATGITRIKHGETSVDVQRADLGKFLAAQYRLKNGDASASADIEAIDAKLAKISADSLKSAEIIAKNDNQATRISDLDDYRERALGLSATRMARSGTSGRPLTPVQQRGNIEIDAARQQVASLSPAEIRRRTAKNTDTGRENPDYDPSLARAATLAGRRKVGDDDEFDGRASGPAPKPATQGYDRQDVAKRFRSDRSMDSYRLGNETPTGVEVLDKAGKVIGHFR